MKKYNIKVYFGQMAKLVSSLKTKIDLKGQNKEAVSYFID